MMPADLAAAIVVELADPRFGNRTHGKRSCATAGCTGPLCKKAYRDKARNQYAIKVPVAARRRAPRNPELDQFLDEIINAHSQAKLAILRSVIAA